PFAALPPAAGLRARSPCPPIWSFGHVSTLFEIGCRPADHKGFAFRRRTKTATPPAGGRGLPTAAGFAIAAPVSGPARRRGRDGWVSTTGGIIMAINVGDRLPAVTLRQVTAEGPKEISSSDFFRNRKVVLFAVPGAFTPACSQR